jgi:hypothetical protein
VIDCPLPSIVKLPGEVFAIAGRLLPSVIVPLTLKFIVLGTVGAAFADVIAARRLPAPVSAVVLTVKGVARENPGIATNKSGSAIAATLKRRFLSAMDPSPRYVLPRWQISTSLN